MVHGNPRDYNVGTSIKGGGAVYNDLEKLRKLTNDLCSKKSAITQDDLFIIRALTDELITKEDALREYVTIVEGIMTHATGLVVFSTPDKILMASGSYMDTFGFTDKELKEMSWHSIVHPDDLELTKNRRARMAGNKSNAKETLFFQVRVRCKDGSYKKTQWTSVIDGKTARSLSIGIVL